MAIDHLSYGAEFLEKSRTKYTAIAQFSALLMIILLFSYPIIKDWLRPTKNEEQLHVKAKKVVNYSELSAPPPIDLERDDPKMLKSPPKIKTVKFLQPVAKKDEEVPEENLMPTMEDMSKTQIADYDQEGIDSIVVNPTETIEVIPDETEDEIYSFVQKMPEFPNGGKKGFLAYLQEVLDYPEIARDGGIEGTVIVGFVVEMNGEITNVEVLRGVHDVLDKEASRVIDDMPDWIPGEQNGQYVRVNYTVPIRFSLINR
jgi:protein TonB